MTEEHPLRPTVTNIMLNIDRIGGEYVTDEDTGYGHFIFNHKNPALAHIFSITTQMLPIWAEKYGWTSGGYVSIVEKDELFWPKGNETTELLNEVTAEPDLTREG